MKFYSGFSLKNDEHFFKEYVKDSVYTLSGYSYGDIKAFRYVKKQIEDGNRVDTLQLFSPAFFQTKSSKFQRLQTLAYSKNRDAYLLQFIDGCFSPYTKKEIEHTQNTLDELEELLGFEWIIPQLQEMVDKGVMIEVYLGSEDRIIDVERARDLFLDVSTVTYIKNANHFLQTS